MTNTLRLVTTLEDDDHLEWGCPTCSRCYVLGDEIEYEHGEMSCPNRYCRYVGEMHDRDIHALPYRERLRTIPITVG